MARLSDLIEEFLKQMIDETDGALEIKRNELAGKFHCVPSQINYVIGTRFTAENGYFVESRRGGGGYIKIQRMNNADTIDYLMHIISSLGDRISQQAAEIFIKNFYDYDVVTKREAKILAAAVSNKAISQIPIENRDQIRAQIFKNMLMSMLVLE